jgi:nucleolar protein 58
MSRVKVVEVGKHGSGVGGLAHAQFTNASEDSPVSLARSPPFRHPGRRGRHEVVETRYTTKCSRPASLARSLNPQEDVWDDFETLDKAKKVAKLKAFGKFDNTTEALEAAASLVDSKLSKGLKKFLKKHAEGETLGVVDAKLGSIIKEKLGIPCIYSSGVLELSRGLRYQLEGLLTGFDSDLKPMSLGLSHSLSRYKLKFSPDKVDTMIVQAIGLLDDLDKELNTYAMRVREWYGWHFPEMTKIVADNIKYAKAAKLMETRDKAAGIDFSEFLEEEEESAMKEAAIVSMGTEISGEDVINISALCDQVIALSEYRGQLFDYLRSRMAAIAPNLTVLVGELVGARLIAHVGSLVNLAKAPASTIQILGAEKALFRALKTKHETPKYGLIYHASLIGQASAKNKGKISRVLAAKCALGVRVDALGDTNDEGALGLEARAKVRCCRQGTVGSTIRRVLRENCRAAGCCDGRAVHSQAFLYGRTRVLSLGLRRFLHGR